MCVCRLVKYMLFLFQWNMNLFDRLWNNGQIQISLIFFSVGAKLHADGRTDRRADMAKLTVAFRNFCDHGCHYSKYFFKTNNCICSNIHKYLYFLQCNFASSLCRKSVSIVLFIPWVATKWGTPKSHIWSTLVFWLSNEITKMYISLRHRSFINQIIMQPYITETLMY